MYINNQTSGYICCLFTGPCTNKDCSGHGKCTFDLNNYTDRYKCNCDLGYSGNDCEGK